MTSITRRSALLGASAAVAVAGAHGMATPETETAVARQYRECQASTRAFLDTLDRLGEAEKQVFAARRQRGLGSPGLDGPKSEKFEALDKEFGVDIAHQEEERDSTRQEEAMQCLFDTPAETIHDIYLKTKAAQKADWPWGFEEAAAVTRDFERLIGGMRP